MQGVQRKGLYLKSDKDAWSKKKEKRMAEQKIARKSESVDDRKKESEAIHISSDDEF